MVMDPNACQNAHPPITACRFVVREHLLDARRPPCSSNDQRPLYCHAASVARFTQVLHDTDTALAVLRARSLLVRLIHSLPTPAIAAAGGPDGLLNITRLLAAQDLAKGTAPALMESTPYSDGHNAGQSAPGSMTRDRQGEITPLPERDGKVIDSTQPDHEPLLKVMNASFVGGREQPVARYVALWIGSCISKFTRSSVLRSTAC